MLFLYSYYNGVIEILKIMILFFMFVFQFKSHTCNVLLWPLGTRM